MCSVLLIACCSSSRARTTQLIRGGWKIEAFNVLAFVIGDFPNHSPLNGDKMSCVWEKLYQTVDNLDLVTCEKPLRCTTVYSCF